MIIKQEKITEIIRVVLIKFRDGAYWIESQQFWTEPGMRWEVNSDGWRMMTAERCSDLEQAERIFGEYVEREKRYAEIAIRMRTA